MPSLRPAPTIGARVKAWASAASAYASRVWSGWGGAGVGSRLRFLLPGASVDYERAAGDLWTNSTAAICLRWIGDNAGKPRMRVNRLDRKGRYKPLDRHPMLDLWARPNPHYTGRTLFKAVALSLKVDGNAYVVKIRDGRKRVAELWWLPHWAVAPIWPQDGSEYIGGYEIQIDGRTIRVPASEIIHFRDGLDPRNDRHGLAPLKAQCREVVTDNEAAGYSAALLRNSGVPSLAIVPGPGAEVVDRRDADAIVDRFMDKTAGDNRGRPVVLARDAKVVEIGHSPEKLRLDRLPRLAQAKICAALGVNASTVGLPDEQRTYANYETALRASWENGLVPLIDGVADTLRWQLLNEFDDPKIHVIDYDYADVEALRESQDAKSTRTRGEYQDGIITRNEARELLGYDPDPAGDVYFDGSGYAEEPQPEPVPPALPPPVQPPEADPATTEAA